MDETWDTVCRAGRWHRGRFSHWCREPVSELDRESASTPYCVAGLSGERVQ